MTEEEFSDLLRGLDSILETLARTVAEDGLLLEAATLAPWLEENERPLVD